MANQYVPSGPDYAAILKGLSIIQQNQANAQNVPSGPDYAAILKGIESIIQQNPANAQTFFPLVKYLQASLAQNPNGIGAAYSSPVGGSPLAPPGTSSPLTNTSSIPQFFQSSGANTPPSAASAGTWAQNAPALAALYAGTGSLGDLTPQQLKDLGTLITTIGPPSAYQKGASSGGYGDLTAWYRDQFALQFPEQVREFDANLANTQAQFGQSLDWQKAQWAQSFPEQQRQYNQNLAFQQAQAAAAGGQWDKQFGLTQQGQQWQQGMGERQQAQAESAQAWQKAMDEWQKSFSENQFDYQKQSTERQNQLGLQQAQMGAFGRQIGPNQAAW